MSTDFFEFESPVTSVRERVKGQHSRISVFVNHKLSGVLVVGTDEAPGVITLFAGHEPVARRIGTGGGGVAVHFYKSVSPETVLVSSDGKLVTAGELQSV